MANVYRAPDGFEPPPFRIDTWQQDEAAYIDRLAERCKRNGVSGLLGQVIRFQRADGYAQYMVWSDRPLELIHLELGDAYDVEDALLRGLRVQDVRDMVARQQRIAALFSKTDETTKEN